MQVFGMSGEAASTFHNVTSPRLVRAAQEFEGQMIKELLKPMTEARRMGDEADSSGVLGEFAGEAFGQALSQRGGFGIADQIIARLSHSGHLNDATASNPKTAPK